MSAKEKERLQAVDPYEFEHFVADVWEADGWEAEVSQSSNDLGVDAEAYKTTGLVDQKLVIQAKRYAEGNKIGRPKIQQYHTLKEQDPEADGAVVVTTSTFTSTAEDWAEKHNVKLVDGDDLLGKIHDLGEEGLIDEYAPAYSQIESQSSSSSSNDATATASESTSTATASGGDLRLCAGSLLAQIVGIIGIGAPTSIPILTANQAVLLFAAGVFVAPVAVFIDAFKLHRANGTGPNLIIWPFMTIMFMTAGLAYYVAKR